MSFPETTPPGPEPSGDGSSSVDPQPAPASTSPPPAADPADRLWTWALAAGLLAGLLTWSGGELVWGRVQSSRTPRIIAFPTGADRDRIIMGQVRSTATSFIQQGAILGVVLGLAGGLARRSARAGAAAAVAGGVLGAAAAAGAAFALLPIYYRTVEPTQNDLGIPMITHGGIWGAAGAAAGLAFGMGLGGRGRWARCAVGGLLGGAAAALVYDFVGALAFPLDKTTQPLSVTMRARLLAHLAVGLLTAVGVAVAGTTVASRVRPVPSNRP
jgi:hypothetical protein